MKNITAEELKAYITKRLPNGAFFGLKIYVDSYGALTTLPEDSQYNGKSGRIVSWRLPLLIDLKNQKPESINWQALYAHYKSLTRRPR